MKTHNTYNTRKKIRVNIKEKVLKQVKPNRRPLLVRTGSRMKEKVTWPAHARLLDLLLCALRKYRLRTWFVWFEVSCIIVEAFSTASSLKSPRHQLFLLCTLWQILIRYRYFGRKLSMLLQEMQAIT